MPTTLGAQSSAAPLPTGRPNKHAVATGGQIAFPSNASYLVLSVDGQIGPINLPYRYWLCVGADVMFYCSTTWTRYDYAIYLLVGGTAYGPDLNGVTYVQNADSAQVAGGNWEGSSLEAKFYCEANTTYHVRLLSQNSPANIYYYQHPIHMGMFAYTVGEGVY